MKTQNKNGKRLIGTLLLFLVISIVVIAIGRRMTVKQEQEKGQEYSTTGFAFDTTYTITLYQGGSQKLLNDCIRKCAQYEQIFSRTTENSELYQINQLSILYAEEAGMLTGGPTLSSEEAGASVERPIPSSEAGKMDLPEHQLQSDGSLKIAVSRDLAALIQEGLRYGEISKGNFDISIEPLSSLWNFTAKDPQVPDAEEIQHALPRIDYRQLSLEQGYLIIETPGVCIDLGGIAKGYIADRLKEYLQEQGVQSGIINLGGNILCIGEKADGSAFRIGIQHPFADQNKSIAVVAVTGCSVVSSGIYERYFLEKDTIYHHILDPKTGYPRENDLMAVTIISEKSVDGDALSTTCFGLGVEEGIKLINSLDGITAVFITKDEQLHYADGFRELLVP